MSDSPTQEYLDHIVDVTRTSGNPDQDFFYLGGPMTGIPQFNFPRFKEVAATLRMNGYNIVSPAEIDDPEVEDEALASTDGAQNSKGEWEDFLARDIIIVSLPTCVGGIFIEGYEKSKGAAAEIATLRTLSKQTLEYHEDAAQLGLPGLTVMPSFPFDNKWVSSPGAVEIAADASVDMVTSFLAGEIG